MTATRLCLTVNALGTLCVSRADAASLCFHTCNDGARSFMIRRSFLSALTFFLTPSAYGVGQKFTEWVTPRIMPVAEALLRKLAFFFQSMIPRIMLASWTLCKQAQGGPVCRERHSSAQAFCMWIGSPLSVQPQLRARAVF